MCGKTPVIWISHDTTPEPQPQLLTLQPRSGWPGQADRMLRAELHRLSKRDVQSGSHGETRCHEVHMDEKGPYLRTEQVDKGPFSRTTPGEECTYALRDWSPSAPSFNSTLLRYSLRWTSRRGAADCDRAGRRMLALSQFGEPGA